MLLPKEILVGIYSSVADPLPLPISIQAGDRFSMVLLDNGTLVGWGQDQSGVISKSTSLSNISAISINQQGMSCLALTNTGSITSWGYVYPGSTTVPGFLLGSGNSIKQISAGQYHYSVLLASGSVYTWGSDNWSQNLRYVIEGINTNLYGYTYSGATFIRRLKLENSGVANTDYITDGVSGCAALLLSGVNPGYVGGNVVAWGQEVFGELDVPGLELPIKSLSLSTSHTLALSISGTVYGWGQNNYSQRTIPTSLGFVTKIEAGIGRSFALNSNGDLKAWGNGFSPVSAGGSTIFTDITDFAIGGAGTHVVAITRNSKVVGWGSNTYGQITIPAQLM